MNFVLKVVLFALCWCYSTLLAQDFIELSGSLPEQLSAQKPYLVVGDLFVSPGSIVTVEPGTVFLFNGFTGLHVQGTIYVKGEPGKPVVFTSKNDKLYNPGSDVAAAPFDWNGIDIYETGVGSNFTECIIKYSVYGVRSQTEHFKVVNAAFSNNGKSDITVLGERKDVSIDTPFSFGIQKIPEPLLLPVPQELVVVEEKTEPQQVAVEPQPGKEKKSRAGVQVLRYAGLAISVGSGVASGWYYSKRFKPAQTELDNLSTLDEREKKIYTSEDWENAKDNRNRKLGLSIAGAGGVLVGLGCFGVSFAF